MRAKPHPLISQILGVYQLLVGGYGALFSLVQIVRTGGASLAGLIFVGMYALVAWAGWRLLKRRPDGPMLTAIAQGLQVVRVASSSFAYAFLAGMAFWLDLGSGGLQVPGLGFGVSFRWMTVSGFGPSSGTGTFTIGVNLVAAAILAYFVYGRSKRKR